MIEIKFKRFHDQDYVEEGYELYVVKNGLNDVLYVGTSTLSIWERWFGWHGHILWTDAIIQGTSPVGQNMVDHLPESLNWKIQLWTLEDCMNYCSYILPPNMSMLDIKLIEPYMIQKLSPILNMTYNLSPGRDTTPKSKKEKAREKLLDEAYRKLFEKKGTE
jgi:hypothetical protein